MKKVLIIEASLRSGYTKRAVEKICELIKDTAETEIINIKNENIAFCSGCCACLSSGSAKCPYKEDAAQKILQKMVEADGVIFVLPNYSMQVPAQLKVLFDRLAYVFHRPRLFHKACLPVIIHGVYGGNKVAKYVNEIMDFWGMKTVKGAVISGGIYPATAQKEEINVKDKIKLNKALERFKKELFSNKVRKPSLFKMFIFSATRASMKYLEEALPADKQFFKDQGWLEAEYYYPVKINIFKKAVSAFMDNMIKNMAKKSKKSQ